MATQRQIEGRKEAARTRRINKRHGVPGRLKHRVAEILVEHFDDFVDVSNLLAVEGQWRAADVYRWEYLKPNGSGRTPTIYGCWETMTYFVKHAAKYGMTINNDREISANVKGEQHA